MSEEKTLIVAGERGVQLHSMEDMYRFAVAVSKSGLAPKGMERPEAIVVAVQMGAELGLPPMASLQNIAVINGRPSVWGDAALAVCQQDRRFRDIEETYDPETETATCAVWIAGREKPVTRTFSRADAERAGLWKKAGPWQQYPQRMLQMRARAFALRDALPGALRGLYFAEEAQDFERPRRIDAEVVDTPKPPKPTLDDVAAEMVPPTPPASPEPARKTKRELWNDICAVSAKMSIGEDEIKKHIRVKHGYQNLNATPLPYLEALLAKQQARLESWRALSAAYADVYSDDAEEKLNEWIAAQGAPLMEIAPDTFFRAALAVSAETTEEEKLI